MKTLRMLVLPTLLLLMSATDCTRKYGIQRGFHARENPGTEVHNNRCILIRSRAMEVTVDPIYEDEWKGILEYTPYTTRSSSAGDFRVPKAHFFQVVFFNAYDRPVPLKDLSIMLLLGDREIKPLPAEEMKKTCTSPAYGTFNFSTILGFRRVLSERGCGEIRFDRDLIDYRLNFINPGDRLLKIVAFPWIPVEKRTFTIRISFRTDESAKTMDFSYSRFEYRTRGKHFINPDKQIKEQDR